MHFLESKHLASTLIVVEEHVGATSPVW